MTNQPQNLRGLKALVGIMAVLIIVGTTVVVGTVASRLYSRFNPPPTPATSSEAPPPPQELASTLKLPAGEHIVGIANAGSELAILTTSSQGEEVLMFNPTSGALRTVLSSH